MSIFEKAKARLTITDTNFKFSLGDVVKDSITGFTGVVIHRTQWLNMCNNYGVKSRELKDGMPQESVGFDEPQLSLVEEGAVPSSRDTGGPPRMPKRSNF